MKRNWTKWLLLGFLAISLPSMVLRLTSEWHIWTPEGFPVPEQPGDNVADSLRVALGKRLFFDPILSGDSSIHCGSCHQPKLAFADSVAVSPGVEGRKDFRNAPSLGNVAYAPRLLRDGTVKTLEMQVIVPIQEHVEMDLPMLEATERLLRHPEYPALCMQAYGRAPDPWVITRAISAYERTLMTGDAPWDKAIRFGDKKAMSPLAMQGWEVFSGAKAGCTGCHGTLLFTTFDLKHNGVASTPVDSGRARITLLPEDMNVFQVPSLRNVGLTAPYMHDGRFKTLEEVVAHYDQGGSGEPNQDPLIHPLHLTKKEKAALVEFLRTGLTDMEFVQRHAHDQPGRRN